MDIALLGARLLLAAVFLVAGLAKLADPAGSRRALVGFGLPERLAGPLGLLLPLAELLVGLGLVPGRTAWWAAGGGLALLLLFVAGIGVNLARGRRPDCHCFGQLHSEPAGPRTLARNGLLAAVAGFVVWQGRRDPGASAVAWLALLSPPEQLLLAGLALLLVLVAALGWLLLQVVRQNGRLLHRLDALEARLEGGEGPPAAPAAGLPVGTPAPDFALAGLHGETLTLAALCAAGKPVLLLFADPHCGPCNSLMPDIGRWQREHAAGLTVAVVSRGSQADNRAKAGEHGLTAVLLQQDRELIEAYRVTGTPAAVVVRPDGSIGSALALGPDEIRALVGHLAEPGRPDAPNGPDRQVPPTIPLHAVIGGPAPRVLRPDLEGRTVDLESFRGGDTLVLFWNPDCGFCQQMLPDLQAWEADPPPGAPKLLVVSGGSVEANRALGLRSTLVLGDARTMQAFGVNGTPMAVLVDAEGQIASPVAAGAEQVLALARAERG